MGDVMLYFVILLLVLLVNFNSNMILLVVGAGRGILLFWVIVGGMCFLGQSYVLLCKFLVEEVGRCCVTLISLLLDQLQRLL